MNVKVSGEFVQKDSYHSLVGRQSGNSLNSIISAAYEKGSVVDIQMLITYKGKVALCQERNRYSRCEEPLNEDGTCPDAANHVVPEPEEAAVTA